MKVEMAEQNNRLMAVDMANGFTYIGKSSDKFPYRLTNYLVIDTKTLCSEVDKNFMTAAINHYKEFDKCEGIVTLQEKANEGNRCAIHDLGEVVEGEE